MYEHKIKINHSTHVYIYITIIRLIDKRNNMNISVAINKSNKTSLPLHLHMQGSLHA